MRKVPASPDGGPELGHISFLAILLSLAVALEVLDLWPSPLRSALPVCPAVGSAGLIVLGATYGQILKRDFRISRLCWSLGGFFMSLLFGVLLPYCCGQWHRPDISDELVIFDRILGLNWGIYARFILSHDFLRLSLIFLYSCFQPEWLLLIIYFIVMDKSHEILETLVSSTAALFMAGVCFGLFPAQPAPVGYNFPQFNMVLEVSRQASAIIAGVPIHTDCLIGLPSFPSIHTAGAMLIVYLLRTERFWLLVLSFNLAMIASVPVMGGHYFVDVLAGLVVAICSIVTARLVFSTVNDINEESFRHAGLEID